MGRETCLVCFTLRVCSRVQLLPHQDVESSLKDYIVAAYGNFEAPDMAQVGMVACDKTDSELSLSDVG